jgi:3',5'-cyclic AMP phosphodiesterase CpdA
MAFITDIHLMPEYNAVKGFRKAVDTINYLKPDFVVTGGDNIIDANSQTQSRADSLYNLYKTEVSKLKMPVYSALGNHEPFGIKAKGPLDSSLYNKGMFQKKLGHTYYSFEHKNWKFFVLDAVQFDSTKKLIGLVDKKQLQWIKEELEKTKLDKPLAIVLHIPLLTSYVQVKEGALTPNPEGLVVSNSKDVLNLFQNYKLKLVLQGHLHFLEDIYVKNIHFITGGAVSAGWWKGPFEGTQEGFVYLTFKGDNFEWKYIDYGWEPEKNI